MKLFAFFVSANETRMKWAPDNWSGDGWHEIPKEPDFVVGEYLEFDPTLDTIVIKKREKTPAQIAAEEKAIANRAIMQPEVMRDLLRRIEVLEKVRVS